MYQIIRELKRQAAGEKLAPEQLKGLIRAGYVYRNGDEHFLTDKGRDALVQFGVQAGDTLAEGHRNRWGLPQPVEPPRLISQRLVSPAIYS
jgi:hypothetical protein